MAVSGQIIDGKYEIQSEIGRGGMSKVYLAMDKRLNKLWAIKEIEKNTRDPYNNVVVQSAIAEANLIKQFDHNYIVRIMDIIQEPKHIYIVEDYIEGITLNELLETEGVQPQEKVIKWAMQICKAFEYLHTRKKPIIYRDMKPSNVMLKPDGDIKIIDFGIAREYKDTGAKDTKNLGTREYAAPEQFGGMGQTDARTDIYCLGATMYHLLTGKTQGEPPYKFIPIRSWNPQLHQGLESIIIKCTKDNPDERYQSCAELLYDLEHYEEIGEEYRRKQKKKFNIFISTVASMVAFSLVGVLGLSMRTATNNADYTTYINNASISTETNDKIDNYAKAIAIKPLEREAYLGQEGNDDKGIGLVNVMSLDAVFSIEEEQALKNAIQKNLTELQAQDFYGELSFEIGKLYWYYYEYGNDMGDNKATRMSSAIQWFDSAMQYGGAASDYYLMAQTYRDIGVFNRDIVLQQEEANDKGKYKPYWESMQTLSETINNSDESDIVKLEFYKLVLNSIETYARKFKTDGITQKELTDTVKDIKKQVSYIDDGGSTKIEELINSITSRYEAVELSIENAYREKVVSE